MRVYGQGVHKKERVPPLGSMKVQNTFYGDFPPLDVVMAGVTVVLEDMSSNQQKQG